MFQHHYPTAVQAETINNKNIMLSNNPGNGSQTRDLWFFQIHKFDPSVTQSCASPRIIVTQFLWGDVVMHFNLDINP